MKNIIEYSEFQVNEKISWKNLLIALSVCFVGDIQIKNYKAIRSVYVDITNSTLPTKSEKDTIDKIRKDIINIIKQDNKFLKFNRPYILDSLKNIQFKIINEIDIGASEDIAAACYIDLDAAKDNWMYDHIFKDNLVGRDNFIIIRKKSLNSEMLPDYIVHEIYHFLDKLLGDKKITLSSSLKPKDNIIDKKVLSDKKWALDKLSMISTTYKYDELTPRLKELITHKYDDIISRKKYLTSESELFARWKTYKHNLVKNGFLSNINQKITPDIIVKSFDIYSKDYKTKNMNLIAQNTDLLFFIDIKNVEKFNF